MRRRSFLQYSAAAGLTASVPAGLRTAWAAGRNERGLFVLVQASGGWDPRLVCDPVIDPMQARAYSSVAAVGGLRYAPFDLDVRVTGLDAPRTRALMAPHAFFEAHGGRLVGINGVDTQTLDHERGTQALVEPWTRGLRVTRRADQVANGSNSLADPDTADPELEDLSRLLFDVAWTLDAFESGEAQAVHLELGGFDTHASHDRAQTVQLGKLYRAVDTLLRGAQARGLADHLTVLVSSEFGRSPHYDGPGRFAGKDHWPVTSALLFAPKVSGGRTLGSTTAGLASSSPRLTQATLANELRRSRER